MSLFRRLGYLALKISFGLISVIGALFVAYFGPVLILLLTGRIFPDHETPDVQGAAILLLVGIGQLVVGLGIPRLLDFERILEPDQRENASND